MLPRADKMAFVVYSASAKWSEKSQELDCGDSLVEFNLILTCRGGGYWGQGLLIPCGHH